MENETDKIIEAINNLARVFEEGFEKLATTKQPVEKKEESVATNRPPFSINDLAK